MKYPMFFFFVEVGLEALQRLKEEGAVTVCLPRFLMTCQAFCCCCCCCCCCCRCCCLLGCLVVWLLVGLFGCLVVGLFVCLFVCLFVVRLVPVPCKNDDRLGHTDALQNKCYPVTLLKGAKWFTTHNFR